ncbi:MAG: response regulator transcription factor [bacterium]|nr:response regulator transcription factor [bacterium]
MKIVIIEDEQDIADLLRYNLQRDGYEAECYYNGEDGLKGVREHSPDLVLLDFMLPGMNGLDVCKAIRSDTATMSIPIIMLTARNEEVDIVSGLEVGADDYVTKPFSYRVLLARVRAVLRRDKEEVDKGRKFVRLGDLVIDPGKFRVTTGAGRVELTASEFQLLLTLVKRPGWVFDRSQLIDIIRGEEAVITDRIIDVMIAGIRKKLGDCGALIETVRGVGYRARELE